MLAQVVDELGEHLQAGQLGRPGLAVDLARLDERAGGRGRGEP